MAVRSFTKVVTKPIAEIAKMTTTALVTLPILCALCMLLTTVVVVDALPGGAPSMACFSMRPLHFTFGTQPPAESPFVVRQDRVSYRANSNDSVTVTLTVGKGVVDRCFAGYLVKAINPDSGRAIGRFREDFGVQGRDHCHAATHTNAECKGFVKLLWLAEDVDEEDSYVVFEATFVESFRKFYVGVESVYRGRRAYDVVREIQKGGGGGHHEGAETEPEPENGGAHHSTEPEPSHEKDESLRNSERQSFWF